MVDYIGLTTKCDVRNVNVFCSYSITQGSLIDLETTGLDEIVTCYFLNLSRASFFILFTFAIIPAVVA